MNETTRGNRLHITIFGRRNAGKSSLINALTGQEIALVSPVPGTTTDPVAKAMELLPLGPVLLTDTAGIDDEGSLGEERVRRAYQVLNRTDLAVLVIDGTRVPDRTEKELLTKLKDAGLPVVVAISKLDLNSGDTVRSETQHWLEQEKLPAVEFSAVTGQGIERLKEELIRQAPESFGSETLIADLVKPGELAVLVVPIDTGAPKGRLILPQVQTLRELLDADAMGLVVKERELNLALEQLTQPPRIVVTDSQAFLKVAADTPPDVLLTSFSILMARAKGDLGRLVAGARAVDGLQPGDKVLIAEACTHHRQADDIGKVKIPRWLRQFVGGELDFEWTSGGAFPEDLSPYKLIVHCGACMLNRREMMSRIHRCIAQNVPIVNYGVMLARIHGVLPRALDPFPWAKRYWEEA
jgi:[FeFe] hydrogenase H-cluster maturation GTPase HydF